MHGHARHLFPIAAFGRSEHTQRFGPFDRWNRSWTVTRIAPLGFLAQRFQNFLRCDRNFIDAYAHSIVNRVGDGWRNWQQWPLPYLLSTKWPVGIGIFDQISLDVAHLHRRWALVFEHRRKLVHDVAIAAISHLFHKDFAEPHVDAAFDLAQHQHRIDRFADVMRDPDALDGDDAALWIDIDFGHRRGIAVSGRWPDARTFVPGGRRRRRVRTDCADCAKLRFGEHDSFGKRNANFGILDIEGATLGE